MIRMPSVASVRWKGAEMNGLPLSTKHAFRDTDRLQPPAQCHLQTHGVLGMPATPTTARLQSSMKAKRIAVRPSTIGPWRPSPVHSSPKA
jgi:hypothetical protein